MSVCLTCQTREPGASTWLLIFQQDVPAISGVRPDLGRPAARFDSLVPLRAGQDVWIFKLVNDAVCRFVFSAHGLSLAADVHRQLFPSIAHNPKHARNSAQ